MTYTRERLDGLAWERAAETGCTYRQFDWWARHGYIEVTARRMSKAEMGVEDSGSGVWRFISDDELAVLAVMVPLVRLGMLPGAASHLARRLIAERAITDGTVVVSLR